MTPQTPTPLTDAFINQKIDPSSPGEWHWIDMLADFARQLERELAALQARLDWFIENEKFLRKEWVWERAERTKLRTQADALAGALDLIATPKRRDGTYNRSREACELLAKQALAAYRERKDASA